MKQIILEKNRKIDKSYFDNYGEIGYSKSYKKFTYTPEYIIQDTVDNHIFFDTLLDAGCASGELVRDFRKLGVRAYGIENNLDILKKSVAPEFCVHMDILNMSSIKDKTFSLVYTNALMYLDPKQILGVLKEMHRISELGVYLCCPFLDSPNYFEDKYRKFLATRKWWEDIFTRAGFEKINERIYIKL